jgi:hypothetical protein
MFVESFKEKILKFKRDRRSTYLKREHTPVEYKDPSLEPVPEAFSCKKYLNTYMFMLWDGLGFFGFDDAKLDRIRRKPASVFDKCNSIQRMIIYIVGFTVLIYVLATQIAKWGMQKSQVVDLNTQNKFVYNITEQFKFVGTTYFFMDSVISRMHEYQMREKNNRTVWQHNRLPDTFDDFNYNDKMWMQSYLCNHTKMYYKEEEYFDYVADIENYWLNRVWKFDCQMQTWANNRIRLNFLMGVGGRRSIGKEIDSRIHKKSTDFEAVL